MAKIHLLDEQTIDKIAAGEVIERPVSVVKELVENALDAGAGQILVEIDGGGIDRILIRDNGSGIPADEVRTAFFRHATSKIDSADDLFSLHSLGFRGEALSSIAAVARVEVTTRTAAAISGVRYVIEGGEELSEEEVGAPVGTTFLVRDLFFNTPVRRKFLKSPQTETSYIVTLMEELALSRPGVAMRLITDGRTRLETSGSYGLKDIIYTLFGRETAAHLRPVSYEWEDMELSGFAGEPVINRGNRSGELIFVNGRFIKSPLIMKAIEQAYHGLTMQRQFPVAVLLLLIPPSQVDVNVHPNKTEIRFRREKDVFELVYRGVRQALFARDLIPSADEKEQSAESQPVTPEEETESGKERAEALSGDIEPKAASEGREGFPAYPSLRPPQAFRETADLGEKEDRRLLERILEKQRKTFEEAGERPIDTDPLTKHREREEKEERLAKAAGAETVSEAKQTALFEEKLVRADHAAHLRLIGQVFDTYWLMQYEEWFLLADQHAAHEKILYERTMKSLAQKETTSQLLMPPLLLTVTASQQETLRRCEASFRRLGFEIADIGEREIRIDAVPDNLFSLSSRELFLSMLDELGEERLTAASMIDDKVALMSCKAAVKGNQALSFEEAEELLRELFTLENPYTCPHGRPTMIRMSRSELERKFKRTL